MKSKEDSDLLEYLDLALYYALRLTHEIVPEVYMLDSACIYARAHVYNGAKKQTFLIDAFEEKK